jgi:ADP-ribosylglycohydrolase
MIMTLYDRMLGGLYGQALGDAWCMAALLTPHDTWQRYGGWIEGFLAGPADHPVHAGLVAGRITDDTEQAVELARAILEDGAVTVAGAARAVVRWYHAVGGEACPYIGPSTRRAVQQILAGVPPERSGARGDTNGAAMRVSVVGLLYPGDPGRATHAAAIQATPTHHTDVAISGAAAVAAAVASALVPDATLDVVIAHAMRAADDGRALGPTWMGASVSRRIALAVDIARHPVAPRERIQMLYDLVGSTLATSESVPAAFGVLAMADGDPVQTAIYAAALGGDADTVGAMACAIAGALRGASAIPQQHRDRLDAANPEVDFAGLARDLGALGARLAAAT